METPRKKRKPSGLIIPTDTRHALLLAEYSDKNPLPKEQMFSQVHLHKWWTCSKCGHEWRASINSRVQTESNCPACTGRVATEKNNLTVTHPELAKEYSVKNLLPVDKVTHGAGKLFWWTCSKCTHEWQSNVGNRTCNGQGCPACVNKVVTSWNNMAATHPELVEEYSPRNLLPADKVIAGSGTKYWWICKVCGYEWQAGGNKRVHGRGCPACVNRVVTPWNNMAATHPELAKEYSERNPLSAQFVIATSSKKFWWKCSHPDCWHEWQARGACRVKGKGCMKCYKKGQQRIKLRKVMDHHIDV